MQRAAAASRPIPDRRMRRPGTIMGKVWDGDRSAARLSGGEVSVLPPEGMGTSGPVAKCRGYVFTGGSTERTLGPQGRTTRSRFPLPSGTIGEEKANINIFLRSSFARSIYLLIRRISANFRGVPPP